MICKQEVKYNEELVVVEYPAMILSYYAQETLDVIDGEGVFVEYCNHDGETKLLYNAITEERDYV